MVLQGCSEGGCLVLVVMEAGVPSAVLEAVEVSSYEDVNKVLQKSPIPAAMSHAGHEVTIFCHIGI